MSETTRRIVTVAVACVAVAVLVFGGITFLVGKQQQQNDVTKAVCLAENQNNATLKSLLAFIEGRSLQSPTLTSDQRKEVVAFYQGAFKQLPPAQKC